MDEFAEVRNRFKELLHSHEVSWKQKAKSFWLKEGDINSHYFHATILARKQKNALVKLHNNQRDRCLDPNEIDNMIMKYFRELFTCSGSIGDSVLNCVEIKVS